MVVRWRKTPSNAVKLALGQLERAGAVVAGAVLSQVDVREQSRTGMGDEMYYFRSYKKYYTS
jgi:Mrp family chromosome partitioning ATPase